MSRSRYQIVHVIPYLMKGGAENHLRILANGQVFAGHKVSIVVLKFLDAKFVQDLDKRIEVLDLGPYRLIQKAIKLWQLINQRQDAVVHSHLPLAEIFTAVFGGSKTRLISSRHAPGNYSQRLKKNWFLPVSILALHRQGRVIAISNAVKESIIQRERIEPNKIDVVYYGIESINAGVIPKSEWPRGECIRFVSLIRFEIGKRPFDLLKAFRQLATKFSDVELFIFGDGSLRSKCQEWVDKNGLAKIVRLPGKTSQAVAEINESDVLVHTSEFEGFGMVYLEAMALSKPIISSRNLAAIEISGGDAFRFYETGNTEQLYQRLIEVSAEIRETQVKPLHDYTKLLREFSQTQMVENTIKSYDALSVNRAKKGK